MEPLPDLVGIIARGWHWFVEPTLDASEAVAESLFQLLCVVEDGRLCVGEIFRQTLIEIERQNSLHSLGTEAVLLLHHLEHLLESSARADRERNHASAIRRTFAQMSMDAVRQLADGTRMTSQRIPM